MKKGLNVLMFCILGLALLIGIIGAYNIDYKNMAIASGEPIQKSDHNIYGDVNNQGPSDIPEKVEDSNKEVKEGFADNGEIKIVIKKSHQKLTIYKGEQEVKIYRAQFGEGGMEDKEIQGDRKTPEGTFYITEKSILTPNDEYLGSRWMRLSYPNIEDGERGLRDGLIDRPTYDSIVDAINKGETPPQRTILGGGIGIHGGHVPEFGDNWTWGCIGLTNQDIEEIYEYIPIGTPVIIIK